MYVWHKNNITRQRLSFYCQRHYILYSFHVSTIHVWTFHTECSQRIFLIEICQNPEIQFIKCLRHQKFHDIVDDFHGINENKILLLVAEVPLFCAGFIEQKVEIKRVWRVASELLALIIDPIRTHEAPVRSGIINSSPLHEWGDFRRSMRIMSDVEFMSWISIGFLWMELAPHHVPLR